MDNLMQLRIAGKKGGGANQKYETILQVFHDQQAKAQQVEILAPDALTKEREALESDYGKSYLHLLQKLAEEICEYQI